MIIAVATQKGGSAKTTTSVNLGAALAERGKRVLVVDLDPQGHASFWLLGSAGRRWGPFVHEWLTGVVSEPTRPSDWQNLDIIAAHSDLGAVRDDLNPTRRPEDGQRLVEKLEPLLSRYDWILLDCPASFDALTFNALVAADGLIIPIGPPEPLAFDGLQQMVQTLGRFHDEDRNPRLRLLGVLASNVRLEFAIQRRTIERIEQARLPLFSTTISTSARIGAAAESHKPVIAYAPTSFAADSFRVLSLEVERRARGWLWSWVAGTAGSACS